MTEDVKPRIDPTLLLPEEPMVYEYKQKKKKKKKKKKNHVDPLKDVDENIFSVMDMEVDTGAGPPDLSQLDPEVTIKVENIEVELDFNDFTGDIEMMPDDGYFEASQEQAVNIDDQKNHEAAILTFQKIISDHSVFGYKQDGNPQMPSFATSKTLKSCEICHLVFKTDRTLRIHQSKRHKAYRKMFKYICNDCGGRYEKKNSLMVHIKRKHSPNSVPDDNVERICNVCSQVFKGMDRLQMHMQRKHGSIEESFQYECMECGLAYAKQRSLIVHMRRKHNKSKKPSVEQWYNCPLCPKIYTNRDTYVRHVQRKHNNDVDEKIPSSILLNLSEQNEKTGEIPCKECPLVFSSINFLKLHMRRKHNAFKEDFQLKCAVCNLSYDKLESLKRHIRRKHSNNTFCKLCNKEFDTNELFVNHTHVKPIIECSICGLIFASRGGLQKHLRCTHKLDMGPKTVICPICGKGFYENRQLKHHMMRLHLNASYPCGFCKKQFKTKESYKRHALKMHSLNYSTSNNKHPCSACQEVFSNEHELCNHINTAHNKSSTDASGVTTEVTEIKPETEELKHTFQCTKCSEACQTFQELRQHYEQNHRTVEDTQCQSCGEIVPKHELQKHFKLKHSEPLITKCPYCEFETTSKASLTQHTLRHKNATSINCDYQGCKYKSYYQAAMDKHKRKHVDLGVKFQCTMCPFQTMSKYILKYHEEEHETGVKKYKCDQCDYATILPANLVQHKYKHSTEKRFKCDVCPFATKYNTSLRFHVKKKHCDLPTLSGKT